MLKKCLHAHARNLDDHVATSSKALPKLRDEVFNEHVRHAVKLLRQVLVRAWLVEGGHEVVD